MKRKKPYLLAGLVLLLFLLCTACGNTEGQIAPQDDPNEGLGGGLSEDTVNDFSGFEGIWLGEADNDYDSIDRKSTRLNSSHSRKSRMPSSA